MIDANRTGQADLRSVLAAAAEHLRQQQALMTSVCQYNHDIADYALAVAEPGANAGVLVAMLIQTTTPTPLRPLASENNRAEQQPLPTRAVVPSQPNEPTPALPPRLKNEPTPAVKPRPKNEPTPAIRPQPNETPAPTPAQSAASTTPEPIPSPTGEWAPVGRAAGRSHRSSDPTLISPRPTENGESTKGDGVQRRPIVPVDPKLSEPVRGLRSTNRPSQSKAIRLPRHLIRACWKPRPAFGPDNLARPCTGIAICPKGRGNQSV